MSVNVAAKTYDFLESCDPLKLTFLKFREDLGCFAEELSTQDDTYKSEKPPIPSAGKLYHFSGSNKHQSLLPAKLCIDGHWHSFQITVDNGSECTAITTATLNLLCPDWQRLLLKGAVTPLSGPSGEKLDSRGALHIKFEICDQTIETKVNVLNSTQSSILLGSPELERLKLGLLPGKGVFRLNKVKVQQDIISGCHPSLREFTGDRHSTIDIQGREPSNDRILQAEASCSGLPAVKCQVATNQSHSIEPWSSKEIVFSPCNKEILEGYDLTNFLFRPCLCILSHKEECSYCLENEAVNPFQLCRYIDNKFLITFVNNRMSALDVPTDFQACVESCRKVFSVEEIARELLEEFQLDPLQPTFTDTEARDQFDMSFQEMQNCLTQIVCEPMSFTKSSIREPTLALFPQPIAPQYSEKQLSFQAYKDCNPCPECHLLDKKMCDPLNIKCVTRDLYESPLIDTPECVVHQLSCYSWDLLNQEYDSPQLLIWGLRPEYQNLRNYLTTFFGYEGDEKISPTKKLNVLALVCNLGPRKVICESTEKLKWVQKLCDEHKIQSVHFANKYIWNISQSRLTRIFGAKHFCMYLYPAPKHLDERVSWDRSGGKSEQQEHGVQLRARAAPQLPPPAFAAINPGVPPNLDNAELSEIRKSPILKETILCRDPIIQKETMSLLDSHKELWSTDAFSVGSFRDKSSKKICKFDIKFSKLTPFFERPRWNSPLKRQAIKAVLAGLLRQNVISPGYSQWCMCPVFVSKRPPNISREEWVRQGNSPESWVPGTADPSAVNTLRLTIDLKRCNEMQEDLPVAPCDPRHLVAALQYNCLLSTLDCSLAFNSLHLSKSSAMVCSHYSGLPDNTCFQHNRVLMGSKQSSAMLKAALTHALLPCLSYIFLYGDDVIVLANTEREMLNRLADVFRNLAESGFKLKKHKIHLFVGSRTPEIDIFGVKINLAKKYIRPQQAQVQDIQSRPIPSTLTQIRSLLGALAWLHSFLPGAQKFTQILNAMTHKNSSIVWTEERLQALEGVLDLLVSGHCINYLPHPDLPFFLACDASQFYAGLFLWQHPENERPRIIGFHSKIFSQKQSRAISWERECCAAIYGVYVFWKFIVGRPTTLFVDSKTSVFIADYSHSNSKISRYRMFLEGLPWIKVKWAPGSSRVMSIPDLLSRRSEQPKVWRNKQLCDEGTKNIEQVSDKLALFYDYSMTQCHFLLDYLLDLSENELDALPDYSLKMNEQNQIECDILQSVDNPHQVDLIKKKLEREQIQKSKNEKSKSQKSDNEKNEDKISDKSKTTLSRESKSKNAESWENVLSINQMSRKGRKPTRIWKVDNNKVGIGIESAMQTQQLDFDALEAVYRPKEISFAPPPEFILKQSGSKVDKFLCGIQSHSPGLDFNHFSKAQMDDPKFRDIIEKCKKSKHMEYEAHENLKYFVSEQYHILCRLLTDKRGMKRFQLCVPGVFAYDICLVAHRATGAPAIQSAACAPHFGPVKLAKLLSYKLYIPKISYILMQISSTCQQCLECRKVIKSKPTFFRQILSIKLPGQGYFIDELQISSSESIWGFKKVLVATCVFSHFCICAPIRKQLTQNYLVELLHLFIFLPYGRCSFLVSDNASVMTGEIMRQVCTVLNISLNSTPRYSPSCNTAELINSFILRHLRIQKENYCLTPGSWPLALAGAINWINYSPFARGEPGDTPAVRFMGSQYGIAQNIQPGVYGDALMEIFPNPSDLAIETKKAWEIVTQIRNESESEKRGTLPSGPNLARLPSFKPGDVVICKFRAKPSHCYDWKLIRRSKYLFVVVYSTLATVYIRPYNLVSIQRWCRATDIDRRAKTPSLTLPVFKVHSADVQKVKSAFTLYNTNHRRGHFKEELVPPRMKEIEVLSPIKPALDYMQPELESDIFSNYDEFSNDDDEDFGKNSEMYRQAVQIAENKVKETGAKIYHYDDTGALMDEEGEAATLGSSVATRYNDAINGDDGGHGDDYQTIHSDDDDHQTSHSGGDDKNINSHPSSSTILRRSDRIKNKSVNSIKQENVWSLGERLANLAGYSLLEGTSNIKKLSHEKKVKFSELAEVKIFEVDQIPCKFHKTILLSTIDNQRPAYRKLSPTLLPHPLTSAISELDHQCLPDICQIVGDASNCNCKLCRDGLQKMPLCKKRECPHCNSAPKVC